MKGTMEALSRDFEEMEVRELFGRCLWVCNSREVFKGFSPLQHALGNGGDEQERLLENDDERPIHPGLLRDGGQRENFVFRKKAEQAFAEEQARRRLERAARMGHRRAQTFMPGDLVYYWRRQLPPKDRGSFQTGKFIGPARVLATETRREGDQLRPGSIVWIHRAGRLLKAAPEQLRKATPVEEDMEELRGPVELPWTITGLATDPRRRTYIDISEETPDDEEWEEARHEKVATEGIAEEPPRWRHTRKEPATVTTAFRPQKVRREQPSHGEKRQNEGETITAEAKQQKVSEEEKTFFAEPDNRKAIEIEIDMPSSKRSWKRYFHNPEAFVTSQVRKRGLEVHERQLTEAEAIEFKQAKSKEVKNFIASECFKKAQEAFPDESRIVGMRWLLTWKVGEQYPGGRKAKARAIVLGYQDPAYENRPTSSPTPSKAGRQLFFQYCAWRKFRLAKGDISGAFLQGEKLQEELWCRPVKEICHELGVEEDTPMLLQRAAYGLVQAPLHWYQSVCNTLVELGYQRLVTEPCCWIFKGPDGKIRSIIYGHVDDFVFGGDDKCAIHQQLMERIRGLFTWGTWERDEFIQCGVAIRQKEDGTIMMSQPEFADGVEEISLTRDRAKTPEALTTDREKSWLRGTLGSLAWLCGQTCFMYSAGVNFLQSKIPVSTVAEILAANKLVRDIKKWAKQEYAIHAFPANEDLVAVAWSDAGWANRPNEVDSTEGIFVGMSGPQLEHGRECNVSPILWRSGKIGRICRSSAAAETIACTNAEDDLLYVRVLWFEMTGGVLDPARPNEAARQVRGLLVTDARNLYDRIYRPTAVVKGCEKRSTIEALALREVIEECETKLCWVHGGVMLSNVLTKPHEKAQGQLFMNMGMRYKIVYDEGMQSEKQRRKAGRDPMED